MPFKRVDQLPLTNECKHYDYVEEVPWDLQKYWHQAYSLFQYYDDDVRLTDDAWFGVTPEPVSTRIAADLASISPPSKRTIVDMFGGVGGNVIAFALSGRWERVIAVEKDPATLACAQHNALVYGVPEGVITWVLGDCFDYLAVAKDGLGREKAVLEETLRIERETTTLFASPPWGGVSYRDHDVFDLGTMRPYNLEDLRRACAPWEYTLYLPRTSDVRQVAKLAPPGGKKVEVVQYCMEGASKAMVVYVPETGAGEEVEGGLD
ncbi:RNA cap guanine-N2 methyltransferase-domain-containing protein [Coniochaeta sp. 2T2.1]|nr:RNA cap guanine-N2 methyltransferase-domain-containing protein [Coniochaeta sp. 2T2.1]